MPTNPRVETPASAFDGFDGGEAGVAGRGGWDGAGGCRAAEEGGGPEQLAILIQEPGGMNWRCEGASCCDKESSTVFCTLRGISAADQDFPRLD